MKLYLAGESETVMTECINLLTGREGGELQTVEVRSELHYRKAQTMGWQEASCFLEQRGPLQDTTS